MSKIDEFLRKQLRDQWEPENPRHYCRCSFEQAFEDRDRSIGREAWVHSQLPTARRALLEQLLEAEAEERVEVVRRGSDTTFNVGGKPWAIKLFALKPPSARKDGGSDG